MTFTNETDAITYVFTSLARTNWRERGLDENTRNTHPTRQLLAANALPAQKREYTVITGSKGKGSVAAITAKLLQSLGHNVGLVTSPHLTTYRQRFRINGRMISEDDLVRLINTLKPSIDRVTAALPDGQYLSPQGIFLAMALKWFDENNVTAAVIEVGRGGRFDDNAIVPNMLSLFTPILLEHTRYLGPTVERIAWHKAGIIKPNSYAYSLPQSPSVMQVLRTEANAQNATFEWLAPADMGRFIAPTADGMQVDMGRYGTVDLPLMGRYEVDNASLAVWGAGNMHARLKSNIRHSSPEYAERIRQGLEGIIWPGRAQKLQDNPAVYVDGAINPQSAQSFINSVKDRLADPVITVLAVPKDRDYNTVYSLFAPLSHMLILTETTRNVTIHFPDDGLEVAKRYHDDVTHQPTVSQAIDAAAKGAGDAGTVLLVLAQPAIGDAMQHYGLTYEQI